MDTETLDKLFLELSRITSAKTSRELALEKALAGLINRLESIRETDKTGLALDRDIETATNVLQAKPMIPGGRDKRRAENFKAALMRLADVETVDDAVRMRNVMRMIPADDDNKQIVLDCLTLLIEDGQGV